MCVAIKMQCCSHSVDDGLRCDEIALKTDGVIALASYQSYEPKWDVIRLPGKVSLTTCTR